MTPTELFKKLGGLYLADDYIAYKANTKQLDDFDFEFWQLKDSHELVEKMGGLDKAKEVISGTENARFFGCDIGTAKYWVSMSNEYHICEYFFPNMSQQFAVDLGRLRKAIADVEGCL